MKVSIVHFSESLKDLLELILAFGNYMNGGTQRGQADGFDIKLLNKLKDYDSMVSSFNLSCKIIMQLQQIMPS